MPDPARLFAVKPLENSPFPAMVFSLSYARPDEWLPHLPAALGQAKIRGRVILDLLACNGNTKQRYFSVQVNPQTGQLEKVQRETGTELTSTSAPLLRKTSALSRPVAALAGAATCRTQRHPSAEPFSEP